MGQVEFAKLVELVQRIQLVQPIQLAQHVELDEDSDNELVEGPIAQPRPNMIVVLF